MQGVKTLGKRTHGELKNAVMKAVNMIPGCYIFPTGVGSFYVSGRFIRMGMKGTPDLVGWRQTAHKFPLHLSCMPEPRFVALEIKVGRDTLRPEQSAFLDRVKEAGGIAVVVRSVEDALKALQ